MTIERTDQGDQHVIPGAERISQRQHLERRMAGKAQAKKPQKRFEATELFSGLAPHQDKLL